MKVELQDKRRIVIEVDSPATAHEIAFLERDLIALLGVDGLRIRVVGKRADGGVHTWMICEFCGADVRPSRHSKEDCDTIYTLKHGGFEKPLEAHRSTPARPQPGADVGTNLSPGGGSNEPGVSL